jgi:hypothetical protein
MKRFIRRLVLFLTVFAPAVAVAGTETQILTYPTDIEFVYDSDRDTSSGKNRVVVVDGDQGNGAAAGGDTGVLIVRGSLYMHGARGSAYFSETFAEGEDLGFQTRALSGAAPALTTGTANMAYFGNGGQILYAALGAGQTLDLDMDATKGLIISGDLVDNEGYELTLGVGGASGRVFIVGTDPAFYICATVEIADVSGTDDFHVGFRRPEVINATHDNYLDLASIGITTAANPAAIQIETIDDNAATVTTDTTDTMADGDSDKFCVYVSGAGAVTYTVDDVAPTVTAAVTLDDGQPYVPYIYYLHATTTPGLVYVSDLEVGYTALKPLGD